MNKKAIGERIEFIRWRLKDSQAVFGSNFSPKKVKRGVVSHWELGDQTPRKERLEKISEWGGVSVYALLNGKPKINFTDAQFLIEAGLDNKDVWESLRDAQFLEDYRVYSNAKKLDNEFTSLSNKLHLTEKLIANKNDRQNKKTKDYKKVSEQSDIEKPILNEKDRQNEKSEDYQKLPDQFDIEKFEVLTSLMKLIEVLMQNNENDEVGKDMTKWRLYYLSELLKHLTLCYSSKSTDMNKEALYSRLKDMLEVNGSEPPFDDYHDLPYD